MLEIDYRALTIENLGFPARVLYGMIYADYEKSLELANEVKDDPHYQRISRSTFPISYYTDELCLDNSDEVIKELQEKNIMHINIEKPIFDNEKEAELVPIPLLKL